MFYLDRDTELTTDLLQKMLNKFFVEVKPTLQRYKNYYDGKHAILNKNYKDASKPCSKPVINYCKNIADTYNGYLATPDFISYSSDNDIEPIMDILRYNDYQEEDAGFLLDALIYGVAAELMFIDSAGKTRFRLISPLQCFGIYDDSLTGDLMYFVRFYKANMWDDSNLYKVDVYSDNNVKHYLMNGEIGNLTLDMRGEEPHYFSQCPANIFSLPDEKSIFDCIINLQDEANALLGSEIDDYSAFCDAYLALTGVDADAEDIAKMKEDRVLILPEGASAAYVTKVTNDTQIENILKRMQERIYAVSQCADFSSERFLGGVSSGVAIEYRLTGMETRAGKIAAAMKKALQRRVEIIAGIASMRLGEEVFRDINITFKRNVPEDELALVNLVNALKGSVSDKTLLGQLPFVTDVNAELEALEAQKKANLDMYSFGTFSANEEDEETEVS